MTHSRHAERRETPKSRALPLHKCARCDAMVDAKRKYCAPCSDDVIRERNNRQRAERAKRARARAEQTAGA